MTGLDILNRYNQEEVWLMLYIWSLSLVYQIFKHFFKTGKLVHVYGWIITGVSDTFDFDVDYIDR